MGQTTMNNSKKTHRIADEVIVLRPYADLGPIVGTISDGPADNLKLDEYDERRANYVVVKYPNGKKIWTNPGNFYEL